MSKAWIPDEKTGYEIAILAAQKSPLATILNLKSFRLKSTDKVSSVYLAALEAAGSEQEAGKVLHAISRQKHLRTTTDLETFLTRTSGIHPVATAEMLRLFPRCPVGIVGPLYDRGIGHALRTGRIEAAAGFVADRSVWPPSPVPAPQNIDNLIRDFEQRPNDYDAMEVNGIARASLVSHLPLMRDRSPEVYASVVRAMCCLPEAGVKFIGELVCSQSIGYVSAISTALVHLQDSGEIDFCLDVPTLRAFINSGFQGLTGPTFSKFREAYHRSRDEAAQLTRKWKIRSQAIARCETVDDVGREDEIYQALVYAAYRPVDMTCQDAADLVAHAGDFSEHCTALTFPADGREVMLGDSGQISKRQEGGTKLGPPLIDMAVSIAGIAVRKDDLDRLVVSAAKRALDKVSPNQIVAALLDEHPALKARFNKAVTRLSSTSVLDQYRGSLVIQELCETALPRALEASLRTRGSELHPVRERLMIVRPTIELSARLASCQSALLKAIEPIRLAVERDVRLFTLDGRSGIVRLRAYLSKVPESVLGRASAGLCSADDLETWARRDFLQINFVDCDSNLNAVNIQLHLFQASDGTPSILARINPSAPFLDGKDPVLLAKALMRLLHSVADDSNLRLYLPDDGPAHFLTNRPPMKTPLEAFFGIAEASNIHVYKNHKATKVYRARREAIQLSA